MKSMKSLSNSDGSFTVEASIIVPLILFILIVFIQLSFLLYNRCLVDCAVSAAVLRGSQEVWGSNDLRGEKVNIGLSKLLDNQLLGDVHMEKSITCTGTKVKAEISWDFYKWNSHSRFEKNVINPVKFVRYCRKKTLLE